MGGGDYPTLEIGSRMADRREYGGFNLKGKERCGGACNIHEVLC